MEQKKNPVSISMQALRRLPLYLQYIKRQQKDGSAYIASRTIAEGLGLTEIQVRKDLAAVSKSKGKPKVGFPIQELIDDMEEFLGYRNADEAVLVGAGSLGRALLSYEGLAGCGVRIVSAFDADESLVDAAINGVRILPTHKIVEICQRMNIHIGIIAVPAQEAQAVCDQLVEGGVRAIWNFAPEFLHVPGGILIHNENLGASLALLSKQLREQFGHDGMPGEEGRP